MRRGFVYLVYEAGNFPLALDLGAGLRERGLGTPVLFSPYYLPETEAYIARAAERGLTYVHEATPKGGWADPVAQLRVHGIAAPIAAGERAIETAAGGGWVRRTRERLAAALLSELSPAIAQWEEHYRSRIAAAADVIRAIGASAVILPEDNVERDSACWVRAVQALGGRAVVVSYGSISRTEAAIAYRDNPEHALVRACDRHFARLYPRWRMVHGGRTVLRLPTARAFAMERLGLAPRDPWIVNTGDADAIAVESEFMSATFARHGIDAARLYAVGHSAMDQLAEATRRSTATRADWALRYGYRPEQRVVLCAMPPDQYPGLRAPEFDSYSALVDGWLAALGTMGPSWFAVVSPHPNIPGTVLDRMRAAGVPVLEGGVANWLPACDLYVASVSSTIKWALACGKPVVNYDCYAYRHGDYHSIDAVVEMRAYAEFRSVLERHSDTVHFEDRLRVAGSSSATYGMLDGKSGDRIAALVTGEPLC